MFKQPLELTNRGEVNNRETERGEKTMKRGGDKNEGAQALHNLYVLVSLCACVTCCICLYL